MPTEEETTMPGEEVVETTTTPDDATISLSDQQSTIASGLQGMKDAQDQSMLDVAAVDAGDVTYGGTNIDEVKTGAGIETGSSYITPEATVSGQMRKLIKEDDEFLQLAEKRAEEKAADIGMLGSSTAIGASTRAVYDKAQEVGQIDAATFAQSALAEQAAYSEISAMKIESDLSAAAREHIYNIDNEKLKLQGTVDLIISNASLTGTASMEAALTKATAVWDAETSAALAKIEADLTMAVNEQTISASEKEYAATTSSNMMAASYGSINELMANPDFMASFVDSNGNVDTAGMEQVFNNFINMGKSQVEFIGAAAGLANEYTNSETGYINYIGKYGDA